MTRLRRRAQASCSLHRTSAGWLADRTPPSARRSHHRRGTCDVCPSNWSPWSWPRRAARCPAQAVPCAAGGDAHAMRDVARSSFALRESFKPFSDLSLGPRPGVAVGEDDFVDSELGEQILRPALGGEVDESGVTVHVGREPPLSAVRLVAPRDGGHTLGHGDITVAPRVVWVRVAPCPGSREVGGTHWLDSHQPHEVIKGLGHFFELALHLATGVGLLGGL
mmetsp:Transcript_10295/g.30541  ORF Transcript_10295/g.30541 Transcript_10295/m.30541 type:complete len:222 (+) Transcript_10295:332-997(+)